jgi:hypothetical protein
MLGSLAYSLGGATPLARNSLIGAINAQSTLRRTYIVNSKTQKRKADDKEVELESG